MEPRLGKPPSGEKRTKIEQPKKEQAERVDILKYCKNEFKMDISFFTKLYEQKIEIYKHRCEYINLLSSSNVHRMKVTANHAYVSDSSEAVIFEYPYVSSSVVEIDRNSFPYVEVEILHTSEGSMTREKVVEKENVTSSHTVPSGVSDGADELLRSMYTTRRLDMKCTQEKDKRIKKRNTFSKKYRGILLNFNTLEEFLSTKKGTHINYTMSNLRRYLKKPSHMNSGKDDGTEEDNIYKDTFWIYKPNELNYFEKINTYLILTFLDLKDFLCYYSLANPVVNPPVHFRMVEPSERLYYFIDPEVMYLDSRKNHINVGDLLYLSQQIDTFFEGNKLFVDTGAFLLLKFDVEELSLRNAHLYMKMYQSSLHRLGICNEDVKKKEEEEIAFASLNSFKSVCDYLSDIRKKYTQGDNICMCSCSDSSVEQLTSSHSFGCKCQVDDPKMTYSDPYDVLRNYNGLTVLPLNCLGELKERLQNMKEKKLKYIMEDFFHMYICFVDPNFVFTTLSWDFRNLLYCLCLKYELYDFEIEFLVFRDFSLLSEELLCKASSSPLLWKYPYVRNPTGILPGMCNAHMPPVENAQYTLVSKMVTRDYGDMQVGKERQWIGKREESYMGGKIFHHSGELNSGETRLPAKKNQLVKYLLNSSVFKIKVPSRGDLEGESTGEASTGETITEVGVVPIGCAPGWKRRVGEKGDNSIHKVSLRNFVNRDVVHRIALEQHVKLIKWKILKDLKEEKITSLKVLILGMGTVGCSVARTCVTWGIKHLTLVDNSVVKHSNVGRQSLYTIDDIEDESKIPVHKVVAAKRGLLKIAPDLNIQARVIDIPMPGHSIYLSNGRISKTREAITHLDNLISNHHVVFLATDSKESRYFPSLLIAEKQYNCMKELQCRQKCNQNQGVMTHPNVDCTNLVHCDYHSDMYMYLTKEDNITDEDIRERQTFYNNILTNVKQLAKMPPLGITIALGFESLNIIRHPYLYFKGGCFYCNDLHSPQNSIFGQALDEKCTVTRGGLSSISGGLSVELLMTLTQHPLYFFAPHTNKDQYVYTSQMHMAARNPSKGEAEKVKNRKATSNSLFSCLGATPHILSLNLAEFTMRKIYCSAFDRCMCCSEKVILRYQECPEVFVENVIRDSSVLEKITGIEELREKESEVIMLD
ncbi:autophagy-related protein 7, putative [Plasmodium knowlesi strain H]|uniref:Autophagy-related protein 7, putative n=3 Tax=Plasmodium knowlesi TaxID=5850 RepID=A0A5K1UH08_PLAKH|nr:autophagy-related protein 7, putative [Plasmodium knowlesi strain H]OTN64852.1 putative Autophagy-related protein 7 [Plasmodium knowlesi]CAA9988287.1 autophagy-related protein 7, putative [Plasmodium knowlesi strain H]SBO20229.1 autophagy-related protein 7, putative [Plasmodium knowlesi strain H]SBO20347.1 autophagy-related protein 7, putative [Plasmodium knowlesi strain H]VVS77761.1 autophagy-related protein 7, putative [Plasmodium knowlesi strain H]|eukprot:XP_002259264.1 ThiF family protein, putative [Plasmodium knowlesi strain H]